MGCRQRYNYRRQPTRPSIFSTLECMSGEVMHHRPTLRLTSGRSGVKLRSRSSIDVSWWFSLFGKSTVKLSAMPCICWRNDVLFSVLKTENMTLKSAKDDIVRTLSCVPGLFGKLCYLAMLRNEGGDYEHWGLNKTHGAELASASMHTAHKIIFTEVLRSPI